MKWIKYKVLQGIIDDDEIFITKKVGYNSENLAIAQNESYDGYTIEEDEKNFPIVKAQKQIMCGTDEPIGGEDGDVYIQIIS